MITCARAGCGAPASALFVADVTAQTVWLRDLDPEVAGTELCARHVARFSVPLGWELHDERAGGPIEAVDDGPQPAEPDGGDEPVSPSGRWDGPAREDDDSLDAPDSPLLARAFGGDDPGRLAIFERVDREGEGDPEGLGEGEEAQRDDHGDGDGRDQEPDETRASGDEDGGRDAHRQDQSEGDDGVEPYRPDELPFPPFEPKPTAGTPVDHVDPPPEQSARPTYRTTTPGGPDHHPRRRGLYELGHGEQPTVLPPVRRSPGRAR